MTGRRLAAIVVIFALVTVVAAAPAATAHVRWYGGVHVGVGPFWWPYPYPWYVGPYYAYPPVVIVEPPVYVEMPPPPAYWYYCGPSQGTTRTSRLARPPGSRCPRPGEASNMQG
jgi:hypothetical protein